MKEYYLDFVGMRIILRTPYEITISESLRPFLCRGHNETDCIIRLERCHALPAFTEDGVWHGSEYYDICHGAQRIFHCIAPSEAAFAVTELFEDGNIRLSVLTDYLSYFTGTAGIFNRIGLETLLLQHKGLLLHASLIKFEGKAIAFSGPSGVGKSTQADLWHTFFGAEILNGDRAALRQKPEGWMAYGSPYAGTSGIYKNDGAPLAAIVLLEQGQENCICRLSEMEAFRYIYQELSVHQWDKHYVATATDLCLQMLSEIPVYLLKCRPDADAALLTKKGLGL